MTSKVKDSKDEGHLRQLAAQFLTVIAAGERQVEIIRKVLFELPDFRAYDLFMLLTHASNNSHLQKDSTKTFDD